MNRKHPQRHPRQRVASAAAVTLALTFLSVFLAAAQPSGTQPTPSPAVAPDDATVSEIRHQLQELQRQRSEQPKSADIQPPLIESMRLAPAEIKQGCGAACLVNDMSRLRLVWFLSPAQASAPAPGEASARPIRVPQCLRGEQWLTLETGRWNVTAILGDPAEGWSLRLALGEVMVQSGRCYEAVFSQEFERRIIERIGPKRPGATPAPNDTNATVILR